MNGISQIDLKSHIIIRENIELLTLGTGHFHNLNEKHHLFKTRQIKTNTFYDHLQCCQSQNCPEQASFAGCFLGLYPAN